MNRPLATATPILPVVPNIRGQQPRHSIVDLSASHDPKNAGNLAASLGFKNNQIRRSVASKRRPSGSMRRSCLSAFDARGSDNDCHSNGEKKDIGVNSEDSSEPPGCRLVLKEFRKRSCAVYEPVLTLKALSAIRPLFFRCVDYLESHADEFKQPDKDVEMEDDLKDPPSNNLSNDGPVNDPPVSSDQSSPSAIQRLASGLRDAASEFLIQLRSLQEVDYALMCLVREVEVENAELFRFQLMWCCEHSVEDKTSTDEKLYQMSAWDTPMLKRLEKLEEKKRNIEELGQTGRDICKNLDSLLCEHLASLMDLIEQISVVPSSSSAVKVSSSLCPHPSLLRQKKEEPQQVSEPSSNLMSDSVMAPSGTTQVDRPTLFIHGTTPIICQPIPPSFLHDTPSRESESISTFASSSDQKSDSPRTNIQSSF